MTPRNKGGPFVSAALRADFGTCRELIRRAATDPAGERGLFDSVIDRRRGEIVRVLEEYNVPMIQLHP